MLENIREQITRLVSLYEAEKQRADVLAEKLALREDEVLKYKEQITELNLQIDNLRLTSAFLAGGDNAQAKSRIGSLIREIDRCIKLLEA